MRFLFSLGTNIRASFRLLHLLSILSWELFCWYICRLRSMHRLGVRLHRQLEKLGPTFVKFGQILSTRWDILPPEVIKELERLQSNVAPFPFATAKKIIERSFKQPLLKIFKTFSEKPVASASLGQVYEARLPSGERVAVKVQRPKARRLIIVDTNVLLAIVKFVEWLVPMLHIYNLQVAVKEFRRWTLNELNYTLEAANADIFNSYFKDDGHIYSPKVFWDYSAKQVLTLEFIDGESLKKIIDAPGGERRKKLIVKYGAQAFARQYFEFGFFHSDPHPGNIFVTKKGVLYFLDFGMVGRLDSRLTETIASIFLSLLQKDEEKIVQLMSLMHEDYADERTSQLSSIQVNGFRKAASEIIDQWFGVTDSRHNLTRIFYDLVRAASNNGFFVPVDVILMAKSIVTLDVVTKALDPDFELAQFEEPIIRQLLNKRLDPKRIVREVEDLGQVLEKMVAALPAYSEQLSKHLAQGRLSMDLNPQQMAEYEARLDRRASKNSLATVVAALFIGSVLLAQMKEPVTFLNFRLSSVGFVLGFLLLLKLLTNFKERR